MNNLNKLAQDLSVDNGRRDLLRQNLAVVRPTMPTPSFKYDGPPFNDEPPQSRIVELEAKLRALRPQYTDKHTDVVSTQRHLDELLRKQAERQKAAPPD